MPKSRLRSDSTDAAGAGRSGGILGVLARAGCRSSRCPNAASMIATRSGNRAVYSASRGCSPASRRHSSSVASNSFKRADRSGSFALATRSSIVGRRPERQSTSSRSQIRLISMTSVGERVLVKRGSFGFIANPCESKRCELCGAVVQPCPGSSPVALRFRGRCIPPAASLPLDAATRLGVHRTAGGIPRP